VKEEKADWHESSDAKKQDCLKYRRSAVLRQFSLWRVGFWSNSLLFKRRINIDKCRR